MVQLLRLSSIRRIGFESNLRSTVLLSPARRRELHPLCLPLFLDDRFKYNSIVQRDAREVPDSVVGSCVSLQVDGGGGDGNSLQGV